MIKPQFEAGREEADKGRGVIRDPEIHARVLNDVLLEAQKEGFGVAGLILSPLEGPKGNREFLAHLVYPGEPRDDLQTLIEICCPVNNIFLFFFEEFYYEPVII